VSAQAAQLVPGPTEDPTTQTSYPCHYFQSYTWNYGGDGVGTVSGRIYWPSATCQLADGPPAGRPMIVFLHGNGMTHTDHDYLLGHLARNGFVAVSVSNGDHLGGSNEGRARQAISFLNGMYAFWSFRDRLVNDIVFAGHSRGGEAAITAARLLGAQPDLGHIPYDVKSVIAIAPTDGGGDNSDPKENLDGTMTRSFLGLYGTRDPDVRGLPLDVPLTGPENTVFAIYDRAGTESSVEGILSPSANLTKSLLCVPGATHRGFLDTCSFSTAGTIGCDGHKDVAKAYFNAFLRWHVFGQAAYSAYFDGRAVPAQVRLAETEVYTQFSDLPRRVLDNFEQGGWNLNTRGGAVVKGDGIAQIAEDDLWTLDPSAPHDTRGLRIKWSNSSESHVFWTIPPANIPNVGSARDVSGYHCLSFRVAQDYLDAWNTPGADKDFFVRLYTGAGWSPLIKVSDYFRIPAPDEFHNPLISAPGDFTKSVMTTVRIPLTAFTGVNLRDVQQVYFIFTVPGHRAGSVFIDSLEFARTGFAMDEVPPTLCIERSGAGVLLSWPYPSTGYQLQETASLSAPNWTDVATTPNIVGYEKQVLRSSATSRRFYRLSKP
jgi:hypothetical protein